MSARQLSERDFVPKVHPLDRLVEADDPMELVASPVEGDPEVMLECLVQEFAWMGWPAEQILGLFHDPQYPALHGLLGFFGEEGVRQRVTAVVGRLGGIRFAAYVDDDPEPNDDDREPELIELGVRGRCES